MAYTYTRTVAASPEGVDYAWTNPASSWITIEQQGNSDSWNITIEENEGGPRSATLTVTHADGVTTDSINVSQAGTTVNPTAAPTATPTATPTPTATTPITTFSMTSNTTSQTAVNITNASSSSPATVTYQLIAPNNQSPVTPTIDSPPTLIEPNGFTVNYPSANLLGEVAEGQTEWIGTIDVWPTMLTEDTLTEEVVVSWGGQSSSFYVVSSGNSINPTRGDFDNIVPTPTPTITPTTTFTEVDGGGRDTVGFG